MSIHIHRKNIRKKDTCKFKTTHRHIHKKNPQDTHSHTEKRKITVNKI